MDSAFGAYALDRNEGFDWTFIPWSFAMWSPFGSRVCSFSIVTKDWHFFLDIHFGLVAFSVSLAEWALVLSYSSLGYVVLRLGGSRVECYSLPHSLLFCFLLCGFGYQSGLSSLLLPYPGVNPIASIVTLVCSSPAASGGCLCECV